MALNNDDIKQLIAILQRGLENDQTDDTPSQSKVKRNKKGVGSSRNKETKKNHKPNKFENMPEFNMCKEDIEIDKKIRKPPPSERKAPFQYIKVRCRVCGKEENVAPNLVETIERYKCNKCATGAG